MDLINIMAFVFFSSLAILCCDICIKLLRTGRNNMERIRKDPSDYNIESYFGKPDHQKPPR